MHYTTKQRISIIADLIQIAKTNFGVFDEVKKVEVFHVIKKAKSRGLLKKQHNDPCLSHYVNTANTLLLNYGTDNYLLTLHQNPDAVYVCIALIATNTIKITA